MRSEGRPRSGREFLHPIEFFPRFVYISFSFVSLDWKPTFICEPHCIGEGVRLVGIE